MKELKCKQHGGSITNCPHWQNGCCDKCEETKNTEEPMKLIYCKKCHDVRRLSTEYQTTCECGNSWGYYTDDINAKIGGDALPLGFGNRSFAHAIKNQPNEGIGIQFTAFVIPKQCPTIEVKK